MVNALSPNSLEGQARLLIQSLGEKFAHLAWEAQMVRKAPRDAPEPPPVVAAGLGQDRQEIVGKALEAAGLPFPFECLPHGDALIDRLVAPDGRPDPLLVLLSDGLTCWQGRQVIEVLKGCPSLAHHPVVNVGGSRLGGGATRSCPAGPNRFIWRPVSAERLAEVLLEVSR